MKNVIFAILATSLLTLNGCKSKDKETQPEPAPDVNDQKAQHTQPPQQSNREAEKAAVECAQAWLTLVDTEKYAESWDQAAELLKAAMSKQDWQRALQAFRKPLGKIVSRKLKARQYTTSLPGTSDGQYVIIQYETNFENRESAIETITPMVDKDRKWRISGYFIK